MSQAMDEPLVEVRNMIQNALDNILSPRATPGVTTKALKELEEQLAKCVHSTQSYTLQSLIALQHTFECNIPSRLLPWIAMSTSQLEILCNKGSPDSDRTDDILSLTDQLTVALSLVQGISLVHQASKEFLGRPSPLEVLVDLLMVSRHIPTSDIPNSHPSTVTVPLTSLVLDTLLCVLVDAPQALRAFEDIKGVQVTVKLLKRAGTPREVRMKCLEFLYFYLLDENDSSKEPTTTPSPRPEPEDVHLPPTVPSTPMKAAPKKAFLNATPRRPISRYGSSTYSFSSTASDIGAFTTSSTRSTSGSSVSSFASTSSHTSTSTNASTVPSTPSSPTKRRQLSPLPDPHAQKPQPRSLQLLKRDVDFVPLSPQRHPVSKSERGHARKESSLTIVIGSAAEDSSQSRSPISDVGSEKSRVTKTTQEKKAHLGTMLGNVDALVDSVRNAGIWGLG